MKIYDVDIKASYRVEAADIDAAMTRAYRLADGTDEPSEQARVVNTECTKVALL